MVSAMLNTMVSLDVAVSCVCLLFAIHMFRVELLNKLPAVLLGSIFLMLSLHAVLLHLILVFNRPSFAAALLPALPLLIGPVLYFFFRAVREPNFHFRPKNLLHFIPAMLATGEMATKNYIINVDIIVLTSIATYGGALFWIAKKGSRQFEHLGKHRGIAFKWLLLCAGYMTVSFATDLIIFLEIRAGQTVDGSIGLLATLVFKLISVGFVVSGALQRSAYFDWIYSFDINFKQQHDETATQLKTYQEIISAYETLCTAPGFYEQAAPSLKEMAFQLGVPIRQLSRAVNVIYGVSYTRHLNHQRVERAKNLLQKHPNMKMIDVMYESGFQSKSSFNKEFRFFESKSPTEYRNHVL